MMPSAGSRESARFGKRARIALVVLATFARAASACRVGDSSQPPHLGITEFPSSCCFGSWAGTLAGTVTNVDTDSVVVLVYAQTDQYYVQPFEDSRLALDCNGAFATTTRGGRRYCALLVRASYASSTRLESLPPLGGGVLAIACAPDGPRRLEFAGQNWQVKSTGEAPFGPGPNYWSDSADNVWVDAQGRLHLMLTQRDGRWYSAEVLTDRYLGYGRYRFEIQGPVDRLDPRVVFAGFFYSDAGDEADVEFSRWGDPANAVNAQYVVQPDPPHPLHLDLVGDRSVHEFEWLPGKLAFASRLGEFSAEGPPLDAWTATQHVPTPDVERMRFNLWLVGGAPPLDGQPVEVVIAAFAHAVPSASPLPELRPSWVTLGQPAPNPAAGSVACTIQVRHAARVELRLVDARGRLVQSLFDRQLSRGVHSYSWDPATGATPLARGIYFLRLDSGGVSQSRKLVVVN